MSDICSLVSPSGDTSCHVPTTAKVHDTILNFERCDTDNDDVEDLHLRYRVFRETLEGVRDAIRHESQARVESMNLLQKEAEKAANDLLFKLHAEIFKRIDSTSVELRSALERAASLESGLNELRSQISRCVLDDFYMIQQQLSQITKDFSDQCTISREIDESILSRASQIDSNSDQIISSQYDDFGKSVSTLCNRMDRALSRLKDNQKVLCAGLSRELEALNKALVLATQARRDSDECIVQAIDEMVNLLPKGGDAVETQEE